MYGIDISKWQKGIELAKDCYDFCIVKATEGIGYIDPQYSINIDSLIFADKLIGAYHFARPDLHNSVKGMKNEADWFVTQIDKKKLVGTAILVLDWEREPYDNEELVMAFLDEVYYMTKVKPFIYGSRSKLTKWAGWGIMSKYPVWMAAWPTMERKEVGVDPKLALPSKDVIPWTIWQYSSTGRYPGYSGNIDLDYTPISQIEWLKMAGTQKEEYLNWHMQWAISKGLFVGDGNGNYRPKDPLTREEAATLLYQYYINLR